MTELELELEKKEILRQYRKLLRHAKPFLKGDDAKTIKRAFRAFLFEKGFFICTRILSCFLLRLKMKKYKLKKTFSNLHFYKYCFLFITNYYEY